jgi:pyruvate ferredoxin oxidoreductase gamma subunit
MASQMIEIRWHARGGQGAKTAAIFLAEAVLDRGKYGQGFPEYGPERRGAPMRGYTRIASEPIRRHCSIESPDIVIVLDPTLLEAPAAGVTAGVTDQTIFLVNTAESAQTTGERLRVDGARVYTVNATQIALDCFGRSIPNMPMIGALLAVVDLMSLDELKESLAQRFQQKFSQAVIQGNLSAVTRAYEETRAAGEYVWRGNGSRPAAASGLRGAGGLAQAGLITEAGNAHEYATGDWRTFKPEFKEENCIHCLFCWIWCPDSAIQVDESGEKPRVVGVNFEHCKGCGICAYECPPARKGKAALVMVRDEK